MAESESGQDKTEDPTEKRKKDSREKGEIARSKELNTLAITMIGAAGLLIYGAGVAQDLLEIMRLNFSLPREVLLSPGAMGLYLLHSGKIAIIAAMPILLPLVLAALIGPISLGGWLFSTKSLAPKFSRMNPLSGMKRMVSPTSLIELLKAFAKFVVILIVALSVLRSDIDDLLRIAHEPLEQAIIHSVQVVAWSTLWMACGLILIAAVDVPVQLYQSYKKLLMTKQEVRDEHKDQEGRPEVKQRIRQVQREMSQRRMMAAIPEADVVITNPTHYAVALKYDAEKGGAPVLLAKGSDFLALKIREIAVANEVLLLESPALARSIYYSTELEQEIPAGLYLAVAQVLAYVYQIRQHRAGKGKRPDPLKDLPIPPDLRRDS
ncbi:MULTISPECIES: flagellar biosynthesis protein FlhB [Pseudomonas]|jgi:flagellar biosynthetic protein FlhB|uniref:Flagellar biosynthetic protein FlhB n=4 Tax=Pseudomonas chlororaphis TaxID=587753 RepID=A0AAQ0AR94_9PSED|nr:MULTISPECIES: flagellar biosynthesis protein FlhB [Pseudomonas]AIC18804.1 flagellar biosynthesis protein FlhB [Pseudomonas chlororaphis]AIS14238.1 flagellar biosynthesis protein FlhB [Pseudomonas chlororaphis subsp. aurantiaca]AUG39864.1 flagellar biosynthesis protein FlhB [Pseudomonas chlororaphis]AZD20969.1 Flagellar biosynthesis protein FlhB [Pseudomonas chlororaphis subsp. aurantiaca]AZD34424.1 Flagellar biosynthesis protein FlhB [Pseudomonas chlororaphis subsp. aurantiaca]